VEAVYRTRLREGRSAEALVRELNLMEGIQEVHLERRRAEEK